VSPCGLRSSSPCPPPSAHTSTPRPHAGLFRISVPTAAGSRPPPNPCFPFGDQPTSTRSRTSGGILAAHPFRRVIPPPPGTSPLSSAPTPPAAAPAAAGRKPSSQAGGAAPSDPLDRLARCLAGPVGRSRDQVDDVPTSPSRAELDRCRHPRVSERAAHCACLACGMACLPIR